MATSGYAPLPSDPPPAYAPGTPNSAFVDGHNKDIPQAAVPSTMSPYPGVYIHYGLLYI